MISMSAVFVFTITFFIMNFKFRTGVCNGCHGIMQKSMSLDDAVVVIVVTVKGND